MIQTTIHARQREWLFYDTRILPYGLPNILTVWSCSQRTHNFSHPRTDPVVSMLAIDESGEKALLGRNVTSCLLHWRFPVNQRPAEKDSWGLVISAGRIRRARRVTRGRRQTRDVGGGRPQSLERAISFGTTLGTQLSPFKFAGPLMRE
jgi:hypothetical protein